MSEKNPSGLLVALTAIRSMVEGMAGDRNRDIYSATCAALREWASQGEKDE